MRTQLKICTEADYLQAHLTVIEAESRDRGSAWRIVEQRVSSVLKKWMFWGNNRSHIVVQSPAQPSRN